MGTCVELCNCWEPVHTKMDPQNSSKFSLIGPELLKIRARKRRSAVHPQPSTLGQTCTNFFFPIRSSAANAGIFLGQWTGSPCWSKSAGAMHESDFWTWSQPRGHGNAQSSPRVPQGESSALGFFSGKSTPQIVAN